MGLGCFLGFTDVCNYEKEEIGEYDDDGLRYPIKKDKNSNKNQNVNENNRSIIEDENI